MADIEVHLDPVKHRFFNLEHSLAGNFKQIKIRNVQIEFDEPSQEHNLILQLAINLGDVKKPGDPVD